MTIAQPKAPAAFLSYAHLDEEASGGQISRLRERLTLDVSAALGERFEIFQDCDGFAGGQHWPKRLGEALGQALFLIPVLTPAYFKSQPCRSELEKFLHLEQGAGRDDLILPIYFRTARPFEHRGDPLAAILSRRQYRDWRELRDKPVDSAEVRQVLEQLADEIEAAVHRPSIAVSSGGLAPMLLPTEKAFIPATYVALLNPAGIRALTGRTVSQWDKRDGECGRAKDATIGGGRPRHRSRPS